MTDTIDATVGVTDQVLDEQLQRDALVQGLYDVAEFFAHGAADQLPLPSTSVAAPMFSVHVHSSDNFVRLAKAIGATEIEVDGNAYATARFGPLAIRLFTGAREFYPPPDDTQVRATIMTALGLTDEVPA